MIRETGKTLVRLVLLLLVCQTPSQSAELVSLHPYAREIKLTGFTRPVQEMTVAAEVSGKYTDVHVDVGDVVGPDGKVARIDATFVELDLEKNRIARNRTERQLELEKKTLDRFAKLISKQSTAQATYDEALLRKEVLELELQQLRTEAQRLEEMLDRHLLKAPAGWLVTARFVEPGEYLRQGEPVLQLANFKRIIVPVLLTYSELEQLRRMEKISLFLPDLEKEVEAGIHQVAPDFDADRRKIPVELRIMLEDQPEKLRGGMRARLTIEGTVEENVYLIPMSALISRYEAHWVVSADNSQEKVILLGTSEDGKSAIIAGQDLSPEKMYKVLPEVGSDG